jgi:hypothetical protein
MKPITTTFAALALLSLQPLAAAEPTATPVVTLEPFEPSNAKCFDVRDKFRQPEVIIAPKFAYPFARYSGPTPTVVVLVQLDENGAPSKLSVLNSTDEIHSRAAIDGLKSARWKVDSKQTPRSVWFYCQVVFGLN